MVADNEGMAPTKELVNVVTYSLERPEGTALLLTTLEDKADISGRQPIWLPSAASWKPAPATLMRSWNMPRYK